MKNLLVTTVGLLAISFVIPTSAFAQTDEQCAEKMATICGDADANMCPELEARIGAGCVDYAQTMMGVANEAHAQMAKEGASLGGVVRSGTGTSFSKVGSLAEGALIEIEENTGAMMNGYPWFKITKYDAVGRTILSGYQWGGIMCSFETRKGVFSTCPGGWSAFEGGSDKTNAMGQDPIAPAHGNSDEDDSMEQPIAPAHGNSDEDNEMIALEAVENCLIGVNNDGGNEATCINQVSDNCLETNKDYSTLGMRQCISLEHSAWDSLLNKDYKKLLASLESDAKKIKVRDAQRHWIKFVDSFCSLGYEINQGTMYLVSGDQCRMEMTARQDLELRKLLSPIN